MKFQDIPVNIITVRIKRSDNVEALQEQPVFSVEASLSRADEFEIRLRDAVVFVRPVAAVDIRRLNAELASGRSLLAQLENPAADGSIELGTAGNDFMHQPETVSFSGRKPLSG